VAPLLGAQFAQAQATDKAEQATAASAKTQSMPKATASQAQSKQQAPATNARGGNEAGKAKLEGVSTTRPTPADSKKDADCHHAQASDA
jgi:hypothetical protein